MVKQASKQDARIRKLSMQGNSNAYNDGVGLANLHVQYDHMLTTPIPNASNGAAIRL
jgi:hypothetical protein